jgi:hypothetical protein
MKSEGATARRIGLSYQQIMDWAILFYVPFVEKYLVGRRDLASLCTVIIPNLARPTCTPGAAEAADQTREG